MNRRAFFALLLSACLAAPGACATAYAKDGRGGGDSSGSGGGRDGGNSGPGGGDDGGRGGDDGGDNSGPGGDDDGGDDNSGPGGGDDDGDGDDSGSGGNSGRRGGSDQDRAREAVREGRALPLESVVRIVHARYRGSVLDVGLRGRSRLVYRVKVLRDNGRIFSIDLDARTGAQLSKARR